VVFVAKVDNIPPNKGIVHSKIIQNIHKICHNTHPVSVQDIWKNVHIMEASGSKTTLCGLKDLRERVAKFRLLKYLHLRLFPPSALYVNWGRYYMHISVLLGISFTVYKYFGHFLFQS